MNHGTGYEAYGHDDDASTPYGGTSGGGGFLSSQFTAGSQSTPSKRRGVTQSLRPVTIKQLLTLSATSLNDNHNDDDDDAALRLDGHDVSTVRVMGLLTLVTPQSTSLRFQLDDGSGTFECHYFLTADDADGTEHEVNRLRPGTYVRVVGKLRTFQGKASLSCFHVALVHDMNELTHHLLDVLYVHCCSTKRLPTDVTMTSFETPTKAVAGAATAAGAGEGWHQSRAGAVGAGPLDYGMTDATFSPEQAAVLDVLGTCTSDHGLKSDQIYAHVRGQMTELQLQSALNYLTSEGHVYSTIDEDHFKRTA